jgi:c-di-GMP-binding flagellar brake protein YcgR
MRPSSEDILLPHLLAEGSSVYVFGEQRIFCPRYVASVVRATHEFLELQLDPDDLSEARIAKGQPVLVGFAVSQRQMRFGARTVALATRDRGRLVVSAPHKLEKWPQRGYVRAPLGVPCELSLSVAGQARTVELKGSTADISASGARLDVAPAVDEQELASATGTLRLYFPERDPIVSECTVVRILPPTQHGRCSFAVQYQNLGEQDEMQIQLLVLRATARRFLRVEASVPCKLEVRGEGGELVRYAGVSENLSAGGLLMNVNEHVPVRAGSRVALELTLPTRYLALADVEVVRATHFEGQSRVALAFDGLEELDYQSLIRFVIGQLRGVSDAAAFGTSQMSVPALGATEE